MERKGKRVCLFILLAVASSAFGSVNVAPRSVIYVSQFFELREDKTPSKLVFNGSSRVARTSGPLSQNPLMQRITLRPGWNLRSLAVTASNALIQLAPASAAHKWVQESSHFTPVTAGETLSAGTVLWLHATVPGSLPVRGAYAQPGTVNVPAGGSFIGAAGFRQWDLANSLPATVSLWKPAKANARWTSAAAAAGEERDAGLTQLSPGEAMYIQPTTPLELRAPDPALDLLYSHEDHLGSSTCVSDSLGRTAEATAFYPFGVERASFKMAGGGFAYGFTRKERDPENGLILFDSRHLMPVAARFIRVDSLADKFKQDMLNAPQQLNPYSYCLNNPLALVDPDGREARVIYHGNNRVTIQVAIQYVGPLATKKNIARANTGIEKHWTGKFGRYRVKMEVVDPAKDSTLQPAVITLTGKDSSNKYLRSFVNVEADTGQWNPKDSDFSWVAAHETGHLMGLDDRYTDKKGADRGWGGNMMGENRGRVQERNIKELVQPTRTMVLRAKGAPVYHHRRFVDQSPAAIKAAAAEREALERDLAIQRNAWDLSDK